ncbi:MAG: hypothetical protein ACK46Q_12890 [Hyphomonas sp.]
MLVKKTLAAIVGAVVGIVVGVFAAAVFGVAVTKESEQDARMAVQLVLFVPLGAIDRRCLRRRLNGRGLNPTILNTRKPTSDMSKFIRVIGAIALAISGIAFLMGMTQIFDFQTEDEGFALLGTAVPGVIGSLLLLGFAELLENVTVIKDALTSRDRIPPL